MGKNAGTILGGVLTATGFGAPIGIPLAAADLAQGGSLLEPPEFDVDIPKDDPVNEDIADAAERERIRRSQTRTDKAGSAGAALTAAVGKTKLGGTS